MIIVITSYEFSNSWITAWVYRVLRTLSIVCLKSELELTRNCGKTLQTMQRPYREMCCFVASTKIKIQMAEHHGVQKWDRCRCRKKKLWRKDSASNLTIRMQSEFRVSLCVCVCVHTHNICIGLNAFLYMLISTNPHHSAGPHKMRWNGKTGEPAILPTYFATTVVVSCLLSVSSHCIAFMALYVQHNNTMPRQK